MKNLTVLLFCLLSFGACKPKKVIDFNVTYKPNSVYTLKTERSSKVEMETQRNDEAADKNSNENIQVKENTSKQTANLRTGLLKPDQSFSWKMTFDSITSTNTKNNIENPLSEFVFEGTYNKLKEFHIDSLITNTVDKNVVKDLETSVAKIAEQFSFPSAQMRIGDEITQNTPVEWKMGNSETIQMHVRTKFTLKSIKDDLAFFDIAQNLDSISSKGKYIEGTGDGAGSCEYNFRENYIAQYQTVSNTDMTLKVFGQNLKVRMNSTYNQKIFLEKL